MKLEKYKVTPGSESSEKLTFYDEQGNPIGIVDRQPGIEKGLLLEAVQLWIINPDTNEVLMQRRSKEKKNNPNKIDVSVSGHVQDNEIAIHAMLREAEEEIGIDRQKLCNNMKKIMEDKINLENYGNGRIGRYIAHIYLAFLDNPLSYYTKQDSEVEELFFMPFEELKQRVRNQDKEMLMPNSDSSERLFEIIDKQIISKSKNIEKNKLD